MKHTRISRREFAKKTAYLAPIVLTLQAAPMYAKAGSTKDDQDDQGEDNDPGDQGKDRKRK